MAIVEMKKISVLGLASVKDGLMEALMDLGVMELNRQESKLADETWTALVTKDGNDAGAAQIDDKISEVSQALEIISRYDTAKSPLFKTRRRITPEHFRQVLTQEDAIRGRVEQVLILNLELNELRSEVNKIIANQLSLEPWLSYTAPLELQGTKYASVITGTLPHTVELDPLKREIDEKTRSYEIHFISGDIEQHYLSVICLKKERERVLETLTRHGFNRMTFKDMRGTPAESMAAFERELADLAKKRTRIEKKIGEAVRWKFALECLYDDLLMQRDKEKMRSRLLKTKETFYMDGWLPLKSVAVVEKLLLAKGCWYEIADPDDGDEAPTLLRNSGMAAPFEAITGLYGMPSVKAVDPTPFLAPFYCLFFGIMLGDAGYGILMTAAAFLILKKYPLEGMTFRMIKMLFYCGISTVFWGAMFGSWFGNLVPSVANVFFEKKVTIAPLWFDPVGDPLRLLFFSFILGAIHLMVALGLKAWILVKNGKILDAVCDTGFWYAIFIGIALLIVPETFEIGKWVAAVGAAGLLLTGGRAKKSIFGKISGGFGAVYGIVNYFADILSYSRLLALGLASGVIAQVINTMGSLAGGGILGGILMTAVGVFGHSFNLAINALGSFVHSCRLQYVEFFGKFFGKEGIAFDPFDKKTKYVLIRR
ncbi:MAG TPA: V-type ATP synthase subunit I [Anaerovoracaceae bacterium]|nr:V-type ATP synthase subunit I [Anaerovoracaceae bacterium]